MTSKVTFRVEDVAQRGQGLIRLGLSHEGQYLNRDVTQRTQRRNAYRNRAKTPAAEATTQIRSARERRDGGKEHGIKAPSAPLSRLMLHKTGPRGNNESLAGSVDTRRRPRRRLEEGRARNGTTDNRTEVFWYLCTFTIVCHWSSVFLTLLLKGFFFFFF